MSRKPEAVRLEDILGQDFRVIPPIGRARDMVLGVEDECRVGYITLGDGATVHLYRKGKTFGIGDILRRVSANFDEYVKADRVVFGRVHRSDIMKAGFYNHFVIGDKKEAKETLLGELEKRDKRWHRIAVWDSEFTLFGFSDGEFLAVVLSKDSVSFFLGEPLEMGRLRSFLGRWLR
jgi:hypothetical protein